MLSFPKWITVIAYYIGSHHPSTIVSKKRRTTLYVSSLMRGNGIISYPHYGDFIMREMTSQITSLAIVYSTIYSGADQRKHQSSASVAFMREIHWWSVTSPHKGPVTQKIFPFDDVIMRSGWAALAAYKSAYWLQNYTVRLQSTDWPGPCLSDWPP